MACVAHASFTYCGRAAERHSERRRRNFGAGCQPLVTHCLASCDLGGANKIFAAREEIQRRVVHDGSTWIPNIRIPEARMVVAMSATSRHPRPDGGSFCGPPGGSSSPAWSSSSTSL